MSISRGSFLRALIGAPFAAKAVERMIAAGGPAPTRPIEPVKPTPQAPYEQANVIECDASSHCAITGFVMLSGVSPYPHYIISG